MDGEGRREMDLGETGRQIIRAIPWNLLGGTDDSHFQRQLGVPNGI